MYQKEISGLSGKSPTFRYGTFLQVVHELMLNPCALGG